MSRNSRQLSGSGLLVLFCDSQTTAILAPGLSAIWCPLKGRADFAEAGTHVMIPRRYVYVPEGERTYDVDVPLNSTCMAIIGSQLTWASVGAFALNNPGRGHTPALFPALHRLDLQSARKLVAFARECISASNKHACARQVSMLSEAMNSLQGSLELQIDRCPGQTISRRRSVFLRLQRTRNYVQLHSAAGIDVTSMAHMANYSVSQFIRIFSHVFGETPKTYVSRCRYEFASSLLRTDCGMGVSDVAEVSGFASRSSFSRTMRRISGLNATQLRQKRKAAGS